MRKAYEMQHNVKVFGVLGTLLPAKFERICYILLNTLWVFLGILLWHGSVRFYQEASLLSHLKGVCGDNSDKCAHHPLEKRIFCFQLLPF
jgi:hypothetical protein